MSRTAVAKVSPVLHIHWMDRDAKSPAVLTVDKGIFELGPAPDATLILLGVLVRLSVAVLPKSRPKVERVDVSFGFTLVALLLRLRLTRGGHTVEAVKGL